MTSGRALARAGLAALAFASLLAVTRSGLAHELRPGSLEIATVGGGRYEVSWNAAPGEEAAHVQLPPGCAREDADARSDRRFFIDCGAAGLAGHSVGVTGLAPLRDEVLVRLHLGEGPEISAMLTAARPSLVVPTAPADRPALTTTVSYATAGAEHLITGLDHVLFVLGLLLLVRSPGALVRAITAFTLAHSLTLALSVLGAVKLPPAPVEAAIALSVLLLARELARPPAEPTLIQRRPWVAAFGFGLLHGLGFAGGLAVFQLPRRQIAAALLGFNTGLEVAQLGLVLVTLALARALGTSARRWPVWTARMPAYGLGGVATFWLLQRVSAFWS